MEITHTVVLSALLVTCMMGYVGGAPGPEVADPSHAGSIGELHYRDLREMMEHIDRKLDDITKSVETRIMEMEEKVTVSRAAQTENILSMVADQLRLNGLKTEEKMDAYQAKVREETEAVVKKEIQRTQLSLMLKLHQTKVDLSRTIMLLRSQDIGCGPARNPPSPPDGQAAAGNQSVPEVPGSPDVTSLTSVADAVCSWSVADAGRTTLQSLILDRVKRALNNAVSMATGYPTSVCPGATLEVRYTSDDLDLLTPEPHFRPQENCEDGWFVLLRRRDGSVNFTQPWEEYAAGFGQPKGEFWLGNRRLHNLTTSGGRGMRMRVEMTDWNGEVKVAEYNSFYIDSEPENFRLHVGALMVGAESGADSLQGHNNMAFSTYDRDNDKHSINCAHSYKGGWWYNACHSANPTGLYLPQGSVSSTGVVWQTAYKDYRSLKAIVMKLKPHVLK